MGVVSFKVAKMGTRYRPKPVLIEEEDEGSESFDEGNFKGIGEMVSDISDSLAKPRQHSAGIELEVSFVLNLFPNGFSLGEAPELLNGAPEKLFPYNRESETLLSAIEYGCLPGDALEDFPFKYVNGSVLCQIQDYRDRSIPIEGIHFIKKSPIVHRVTLQMCMENVVKDMLSISDDSWTYEDILSFESRVLKVLQPVLYLNPLPLRKKVDLEISWSWKKRERSNAPTTSSVLNNSYHITDTPGNFVAPKSHFQIQSANQDRGVALDKENYPIPIPNQENNILVEKRSGSHLSTSQPKAVLDLAKKQNEPKVAAPKRDPSKRGACDRTKRRSSNLGAKANRQQQANNQRPVPKKPKTELTDWSSFLSLPKNATSPDQRIEAGKTLHGGPRSKANLNVVLSPLPSSTTCAVKQEPVETHYPSSDFRSTNGVQLQNHQQPHLLKSNNPLSGALPNPTIHPFSRTLQIPINQSINSYSETAPVMERFRKIGVASQRDKLTNKRKLDQYLSNQPYYHPTLAVASLLSTCEDIIELEDSASEKNSLSKISISNRNVPNVRTLTFVRKQCQEEGRESQVRLVLQQNLNYNKTVEANIQYGREDETNPTIVSLSPAFPTSCAADLFASQFSSLMSREGYDLESDHIDRMSLTKPSNTKNQSSQRFELTSLVPIPSLSNRLLSPVSPNMSHLNSSSQLLQPNIRNANFPVLESHLNVGPQFNSLPLQTQESIYLRAQIQHQIQQRVRQQEQLMQLTTLLGGSGGSTVFGSRPHNELGSFGPNSLAIGNIGYQRSNQTDNMSDLASSPPNYLDVLNDHLRVSRSNVPVQRRNNGEMASMNMPNVLEMPCNSSNQSLDAYRRVLTSNAPIQRRNSGPASMMNMPNVSEMPCNASNQSLEGLLRVSTSNASIRRRDHGLTALMDMSNVSEMPCNSSDKSLDGLLRFSTSNVPIRRINNGLTALLNMPNISEMPCNSSNQSLDGLMRPSTSNVPIQRINNGLTALMNMPNVSEMPCNTSNHHNHPFYEREMQWPLQQTEMRSPVQNFGPSISSVATLQQFAQQPRANQRQSSIVGSVMLEETANMNDAWVHGKFEKGYGWK